MNITQEQNNAAGKLVDLIAAKIGNNRAIHPETAISASARLSGSLLLRSFNLRLESFEQGAVLLSNEANDKGPMLINTLRAYLSASKVALDPNKLGGQVAQRGEEPRLDILSALAQLQDEAINICEADHLNLEQSAQAAALATAFIVKECAPQIGAETAFNVAVFGFIEGSKTVPPSMTRRLPTAASSKRWYKFWQ